MFKPALPDPDRIAQMDRSNYADYRAYMILRPDYFRELWDCEPTEQNIKAAWEETTANLELPEEKDCVAKNASVETEIRIGHHSREDCAGREKIKNPMDVMP